MFERWLIGAALCLPLAGWATDDLQDPTRPPSFAASEPAAASQPSAPRLQLNSILIARDRRVAVINGEPVRVGSRIGGAHVLSIEPSRVVLRRGDRLLALSLLNLRVKEIVRTPSE